MKKIPMGSNNGFDYAIKKNPTYYQTTVVTIILEHVHVLIDSRSTCI